MYINELLYNMEHELSTGNCDVELREFSEIGYKNYKACLDNGNITLYIKINDVLSFLITQMKNENIIYASVYTNDETKVSNFKNGRYKVSNNIKLEKSKNSFIFHNVHSTLATFDISDVESGLLEYIRDKKELFDGIFIVVELLNMINNSEINISEYDKIKQLVLDLKKKNLYSIFLKHVSDNYALYNN